jgi:hypothetical protein
VDLIRLSILRTPPASSLHASHIVSSSGSLSGLIFPVPNALVTSFLFSGGNQVQLAGVSLHTSSSWTGTPTSTFAPFSCSSLAVLDLLWGSALLSSAARRTLPYLPPRTLMLALLSSRTRTASQSAKMRQLQVQNHARRLRDLR